jgi:hypothetical protein
MFASTFLLAFSLSMIDNPAKVSGSGFKPTTWGLFFAFGMRSGSHLTVVGWGGKEGMREISLERIDQC